MNLLMNSDHSSCQPVNLDLLRSVFSAALKPSGGSLQPVDWRHIGLHLVAITSSQENPASWSEVAGFLELETIISKGCGGFGWLLYCALRALLGPQGT